MTGFREVLFFTDEMLILVQHSAELKLRRTFEINDKQDHNPHSCWLRNADFLTDIKQLIFNFNDSHMVKAGIGCLIQCLSVANSTTLISKTDDYVITCKLKVS